MKKIILVLIFSLAFFSCDDSVNKSDENKKHDENNNHEQSEEEKIYSATLGWFNNFIKATSLQKEIILADVSSTPQNWCGRIYNVKQKNSGEYEISLDFNSYDIGAPMIKITTRNLSTATSVVNKKGDYFMAINKGEVTYYHYIYHTIFFEID